MSFISGLNSYHVSHEDLFAEAVEFASNVDFSYSHTVGDHVSYVQLLSEDRVSHDLGLQLL
jgi:hypothetical protein